MSDDDPVERFVEQTFDGEDDGVSVPETRDMEAELRERMATRSGGDTEMAEIDSETATAFWAAVILVNIGIMLVALGPTIYLIRGYPLGSAAVVVAGVVALVRAYSVYRSFSAEDDTAEPGVDTADRDPDDGDDSPTEDAAVDET